DDGTGACPYIGPLTIYNNIGRFVEPMLLGFASKYDWDHYTYTDAVLVGVSYYDPKIGTIGPFLQPFSGGPDSWRTATLSGDDFDWSLSYTHKFFEYEHYPSGSICDFDVYSYAPGAYGAANTSYGTLPCSYGYVDVFTFEGAAGGTAYLTVDTTSSSPALD